jgi:HAD superfamily hydrolase (TIGR01549 family)
LVNFETITTLLFDIDNTLLKFDELDFMPIYTKLIHRYFHDEMPDFNNFVRIFLESTYKMVEKDPQGLTTLSRFEHDFMKHFETLKASDIHERFLHFYQNEFNQLKQIMKPDIFAKPLLTLAANHFTLVAATNPLFPSIANEIRLNWGGIGRNNIHWNEITSADDYHFAKPHIEYYQEILDRLNKDPFECLMIGNDPVNDMIAGKIQIKTFLIVGDEYSKHKVIRTSLDKEKPRFPFDFSGTLEDFYESLKQFIKSKEA